jgi:hypothetical protein
MWKYKGWWKYSRHVEYEPKIVSKRVRLCVFSHCPGTIMAPADEALAHERNFWCVGAAAGGAFPCHLVAHAAGDAGDEMSFTYYLPTLSAYTPSFVNNK